MEERSLRVYQQKTFFSKIGTTISKMLIPTKVGFNGMLISVKRNNLLKSYEAIKEFNGEDIQKKENLNKKYEDIFTLYLESIDKFVMESIYKKVKSESATSFEQEALSKYYMITNLKETQYLEYKYRKQKYLLELDYESVRESNKEKVIQRYNKFYIEKMDSLYKGILKNYSVQLADNLRTSVNDKNEIYDKIFDTVEEYLINILNLKINSEDCKVDKETLEHYDKYSRFLVGKPDTLDILEKKKIILIISRKLFTHSLPLITAEQCYQQLLNEVRSELVHSKNDRKYNKAYKMLLTVIEEYNINLLSTKIYWEKPKERDEYKKFYEEFKKIEKAKDSELKKEILFIKNDLEKVSVEPDRYKLVIAEYRKRLVELGAVEEVEEKSKTKEEKLEKKTRKTAVKTKGTKNASNEKKKKEVKKEATKVKEKKNKEAEITPKKRGRPRKNV